MTPGANQTNTVANEPTSRPAVTHDVQLATDRQSNTVRIGLSELPTLISISRAANFLGISRASAYRYAARGDLPTIRLGGRLYIVTARLSAFLEAV